MSDQGTYGPTPVVLQSGKPFLGICLGLQLMFEGSTESGGVEGLGIVPGAVAEFDRSKGLPVPHIGWNSLQERYEALLHALWTSALRLIVPCQCRQDSRLLAENKGQRFYFVHSYRAVPSEQNKDWLLAESHYGETFVAALQKGDTYATQFHPEKSGAAGLSLLKNFFESYTGEEPHPAPVVRQVQQQHANGMCSAMLMIMIGRSPPDSPHSPSSCPFIACMAPLSGSPPRYVLQCITQQHDRSYCLYSHLTCNTGYMAQPLIFYLIPLLAFGASHAASTCTGGHAC